ncbi:MAG: hypothetical protein J0M19_04330 [Sphingomonadales bacterium]|nr:hypothetical protein [Sphingomonadales bacterium]
MKELEAMSPDQLDELLGLKPKYDMPAAARRSMKQVGVLAEDEGGFPAASLGRQNPALVKAVLEGNKGRLVSRWGHITLRRGLVSRLDAPAGTNPADFAGWRAALLVRMGEGHLARSVVQDVDAGNYTDVLTKAAIDSYAFTADITGICPIVAVQGGARKDPDWRVLRAVCSSFQGDGAAGMGQLDRLLSEQAWPRVDLLLAQKYAGAAGKARRAVKIEWDGVTDMNPWRFALASAVGVDPPANLMKGVPVRYAWAAATAPMLGLEARAAGADRAAAAGILSSSAMVDLYGQIFAQQDIKGQWADAAADLRTAYVGATPADRLAAMRKLWDAAPDAEARYSRMVLTAYAAARMPVSADLAADAPDLIASMLTAGLDQNALKWATQADVGTLGWAMLALAAPQRDQPVDSGALNGFYGNDESEGYRKSAFLLAGLAGLGRIDDATAKDFADKLEVDLSGPSNWARLIDQAADANNRELVVLLAGVGMQGSSWDKMTARHLYHIVAALNRVGLAPEARMIAAEAVARG